MEGSPFLDDHAGMKRDTRTLVTITGKPDVEGSRIITVSGNSMMPLYRHGDQLIVSDYAPIAIGDRIVIESEMHGTLGGTLLYRDGSYIALMLGGRTRRELQLASSDIHYVGRVIWASQ